MRGKSASLTWQVFVAPAIPVWTKDDVPPGSERRMFSPVSATLITGQRDAVLVDTLMTVDQTRALGDWIAATGKNLTTIYLTHGHGDHVFGIGALQKRFPAARAYALPAVIEFMRRQLIPESLDGFWRRRFPGQIPDDLGTAEPILEGVPQLEGHDLVPVTPPACTFLRSAWWWRAMLHTTMFTSFCRNPTRSCDASGSPPSIRSNRSIRPP